MKHTELIDMILSPGYPRFENNKYILDKTALINSMAAAMETEMEDVYLKVKGTDLPAAGREDLRILLVAISRGILQYLDVNEGDLLSFDVSHKSAIDLSHQITNVKLNIDTKKPSP